MAPTSTSPDEAALVAVLDVGGTTTTVALADDITGLLGYRHEVPSPTDADRVTIVESLIGLLTGAALEARELGASVGLVAVCIPGPFEYEQGRSLMQHKFASLYDSDLRTPIEKACGCPVVFVNDANAFGIGAWLDAGSPAGRFGALTLGTGIGSCFLDDGRPLHDHPDVPSEGEIWSLRYRDGTIEDAVSARSIVAGYRQRHGGPDNEIGVDQIAERARDGDGAAVSSLVEYGHHLGAAIAIGFAQFDPISITIGGKIVGAWDLMGPAVEAELVTRMPSPPQLRRSPSGGEALLGGANEARRRRRSEHR